jgi:deferrochelatase/peroxidase EfeB
MAGGSYMVTRKIRMVIETWDRTSLGEQEALVGRTKGTGAPLGAAAEFDEPNFDLQREGEPVIPATSHVRLAHPTFNNGARLLRRGYNYVDGSDGLGRLNAGLFFIAYQRDPRTAFVPVQQQLARHDTMNEYIRHTSSALFAVPPGVTGPGAYWGSTLFV